METKPCSWLLAASVLVLFLAGSSAAFSLPNWSDIVESKNETAINATATAPAPVPAVNEPSTLSAPVARSLVSHQPVVNPVVIQNVVSPLQRRQETINISFIPNRAPGQQGSPPLVQAAAPMPLDQLRQFQAVSPNQEQVDSIVINPADIQFTVPDMPDSVGGPIIDQIRAQLGTKPMALSELNQKFVSFTASVPGVMINRTVVTNIEEQVLDQQNRTNTRTVVRGVPATSSSATYASGPTGSYSTQYQPIVSYPFNPALSYQRRSNVDPYSQKTYSEQSYQYTLPQGSAYQTKVDTPSYQQQQSQPSYQQQPQQGYQKQQEYSAQPAQTYQTSTSYQSQTSQKPQETSYSTQQTQSYQSQSYQKPQESYQKPQESYQKPVQQTYAQPQQQTSYQSQSYQKPQESSSYSTQSYQTQSYQKPQESYQQKPQESYQQKPQEGYQQKPQESYQQKPVQSSYVEQPKQYQGQQYQQQPVKIVYIEVCSNPSYAQPAAKYQAPVVPQQQYQQVQQSYEQPQQYQQVQQSYEPPQQQYQQVQQTYEQPQPQQYVQQQPQPAAYNQEAGNDLKEVATGLGSIGGELKSSVNEAGTYASASYQAVGEAQDIVQQKLAQMRQLQQEMLALQGQLRLDNYAIQLAPVYSAQSYGSQQQSYGAPPVTQVSKTSYGPNYSTATLINSEEYSNAKIDQAPKAYSPPKVQQGYGASVYGKSSSSSSSYNQQQKSAPQQTYQQTSYSQPQQQQSYSSSPNLKITSKVSEEKMTINSQQQQQKPNYSTPKY